MIGFVDAVKMFFQRYTDFAGRSSRAEYWWVVLFQIIASFVLLIPAAGLIGAMSNGGGDIGFGWIALLPFGLFVLAIIIPGIALYIRRLHDINQTGWIYLGLILASFIPVLGLLSSIAQIVIACIPGTVGPNKYGVDPFGREGNGAANINDLG